MESFKIFAYLFGGFCLIVGSIIEIIRQVNQKEYDAFFGLIPIIIGIIWIKEAINRNKKNK